MTNAFQMITTLTLAAAVLLVSARVFGLLAQRLRQPAVVGELLAGVALGPTVLGAVAPDWAALLFPTHGAGARALELLVEFSLALFMLTSGMDVDLSTIFRRRRIAIALAVSGTAIPFALGFAAGWHFPTLFAGKIAADSLPLALFLGTALTISALPVIARILMDLGLYRSDLGMVIIGAAFMSDLAGWILFALILGMLALTDVGGPSLGVTLTLGLAFTVLALTLGRAAMDRAIQWVDTHGAGPNGALVLVVTAGLLGSAFTNWLGFHTVFGAFLVGVACGGCRHFLEHSRATLRRFVGLLFAPLFFASIGLRGDFVTHFEFALVCSVLLLACSGKLASCGITARLFGMSNSEAWAVGFALNARGAMEIVLAATALEMELIGEPLFVALVVMALLTSVFSGPVLKRVVSR